MSQHRWPVGKYKSTFITGCWSLYHWLLFLLNAFPLLYSFTFWKVSHQRMSVGKYRSTFFTCYRSLFLPNPWLLFFLLYRFIRFIQFIRFFRFIRFIRFIRYNWFIRIWGIICWISLRKLFKALTFMTLSLIEKGLRTRSKKKISDLCQQFSVNRSFNYIW